MIPKSVAEVVRERVVLEVEGIDRMYLNGYVPGLQTEGGLVKFIRTHLGLPIASTAAVAPMTHEFVRKIEQLARDLGIDIACFEKGQPKDDVMKEHLARFDRTEGVLFIGKAQEKARVFRTVQKKHPESGRRYPWITRGSAVPNHFYFYVVDEDFGPLVIKFCSYFPYAMKVCLNGHEWVKCQLAKEGIAFTPLDNGILWCANPQRLQQLCDGLDEGKIVALGGKWLERLPHPFRRRTRRRDTATPSPSCRPSSRSRRSSTDLRPAGSSSRRSSERTSTSTSAALIASNSSSDDGSPGARLRRFARAC